MRQIIIITLWIRLRSYRTTRDLRLSVVRSDLWANPVFWTRDNNNNVFIDLIARRRSRYDCNSTTHADRRRDWKKKTRTWSWSREACSFSRDGVFFFKFYFTKSSFRSPCTPDFFFYKSFHRVTARGELNVYSVLKKKKKSVGARVGVYRPRPPDIIIFISN